MSSSLLLLLLRYMYFEEETKSLSVALMRLKTIVLVTPRLCFVLRLLCLLALGVRLRMKGNVPTREYFHFTVSVHNVLYPTTNLTPLCGSQ